MKKIIAFCASILLTLFSPIAVYAAISLDTSDFTQGTGSSASKSITIASGASLWVYIKHDGGYPTTAVTRNGSESLSQALGDSGWIGEDWWYLANPTSGTHTLSVTFTGSDIYTVYVASLLGAASSPLGATAICAYPCGGNLSLHSIPITTTAANSWILGAFTANASAISVNGTGHTLIQYHTQVADGTDPIQSYKLKAAAGAGTMDYNVSAASGMGAAVEILEASASPPPPPVASSTTPYIPSKQEDLFMFGLITFLIGLIAFRTLFFSI